MYNKISQVTAKPSTAFERTAGRDQESKAPARGFDGGGGLVQTSKPSYIPLNFSFSSDFGHFIFKMLGKAQL